MTSVKSFVSLNRPWAYIFWSVHEFVIALNFHVLYWRSISFDLNISEVDSFDRTFVHLIHLFMSFIDAFVRSFCSSSGGSSRGSGHPSPPPTPHQT